MDATPDGETCWGPGGFLTGLWSSAVGVLALIGLVFLVTGHGAVDRLVGAAFVLLPAPAAWFALRRRRVWVTPDEVVVRTVFRTHRVARADIVRVEAARSMLHIRRVRGRGVTVGVAPTPAMLAALELDR